MTHLLLYLALIILPMSAHSSLSFECDNHQLIPQTELRSDQITVVINGYSVSRIPLLQSIATTYTSLPIVSSVLVLWGNPATSPLTISNLAQNLSLSSFGAPISVHRQPSNSLNARFLSRPSLIKTRAVLICDDDIEVDRKTVDFAFKVWRSNPDRLIGLFVRSHDIDMVKKEWIYTVHPDRFSMVLTKFMMLKIEYLTAYSCNGGAEMIEMRRIVDEMRNCEDILMNFVVAELANAGPIMIGAERVRDWGDPRNDREGSEDKNGKRKSKNNRDGGGEDENGGRRLKNDRGGGGEDKNGQRRLKSDRDGGVEDENGRRRLKNDRDEGEDKNGRLRLNNDHDGGGKDINGGWRLKNGGEDKNVRRRSKSSRVREVGLSSRRSEHRKRRGKCLTEFHRVLGRMPLRYSHGKVVNSVGEQGLCLKKGKLVICDRF